MTTTDDGEVSLGRRVRATLTRNLIFTCLALGSAWTTAHLLLPLLEQHGVALPVIYVLDGTQ